jgi:prepilin-type N-terminal cleavage/methylation domain-containing protein
VKKGFTLLEMLITLSLAGVVGVLLIQLLVQNNGFFYQQQATVSQGLNLNDAVSQISSDIRSSSAVLVGYPVATPTTSSSLTSLVVAIPSIDSSGNSISNTSDYIVISKDSSNPKVLKEWLYPDPASSRVSREKVLLKDLALINFYYKNSNGQAVSPAQATQINFVINVQTKMGTSSKESSSSAEVTLRNN